MDKRHPNRQQIRSKITEIIREHRSQSERYDARRPQEFNTVDRMLFNEDSFDPRHFHSWIQREDQDIDNYYQIRIEHEPQEYGGFDYCFELQLLVPVSDEEWLKRLLLDQFPNRSTQEQVYTITGVWLDPDRIEQLRGVL